MEFVLSIKSKFPLRKRWTYFTYIQTSQHAAVPKPNDEANLWCSDVCHAAATSPEFLSASTITSSLAGHVDLIR
jgi:hypothetical protein